MTPQSLRPFNPQLIATLVLLFLAGELVVYNLLPLVNALLFLPFAIGLVAITRLPHNASWLKAVVLLAVVSIGFFIAIYRPPGFDYPLVWNPGALYDHGKPFALYVNMAKAIGGYLVLVWLWQRIQWNAAGVSTDPFADASRTVMINRVYIVGASVLAILAMASLGFGLAWQPKWPQGLWIFFAVNLLVTVVAEEAFFRLLLQQCLERLFKHSRWSTQVALAVSALLFALAHAAPDNVLFVLFLFAGVVYGFVYAATRSFVAAVAAHFGVNFLHILLFEYPL